ncbi:capsular polysaccharide transport system permease protein [Novosphingobium kunmingense]|uniref:Capsular polysaccharide transport system permease protein n=1 Tax=Novosphingobium kunmingense TaxID=1211806 RepID=A0A2N0HJ79_9SPHN|nr:capsule biosynthesis protein [Novosphingobium kunmingense]PKB19006.1 capsular polysaccharide transport system permease protein [Novosphingobium kunmingense]
MTDTNRSALDHPCLPYGTDLGDEGDKSPAQPVFTAPEPPRYDAPEAALPRSRRGLAFVVLVVVPSLLTLLWLLLFASPQYQSRTEYVIRGIEAERPAPGALAELIAGPQAGGNAAREAEVIKDFLLSPDAIAALKARGIDVVRLYNRADADILSRLRFAEPRAETLLDYYRGKVDVDYDKDKGVTTLAVRAFAPADAQKLAQALLVLGEGQVNAFNTRAVDAGIALAQKDMDAAQADLLAIQTALTRFRDVSGALDPARQVEGESAQLLALQGQLAREKASLASMRGFLAPSAPQVEVQASRVAALEAQVGALRSGTTGPSTDAAQRLNAFEQLKLRQDFAAKRYESARAALDSARAQADKQRLFFVSVVKPGLPEKPVRPRPWRTAFALFVGLSVAFAIGWLILAGIREHQAD